MTIEKKNPPNIRQIREVFPYIPDTYYAWGDTVFNPDGNEIPEDILFHELVHSRQQKDFGTPELWWHKYLNDPVFRLSQEKEAYCEQYQFLRPYLNSKTAKLALEDFAHNLASPLYQLDLSFSKAHTLLRLAN